MQATFHRICCYSGFIFIGFGLLNALPLVIPAIVIAAICDIVYHWRKPALLPDAMPTRPIDNYIPETKKLDKP